MVVKFLFLILSMIQISLSLNIDLSSVHMVPDLYRLCWRQYTAKNYGYITDYYKEKQKFQIFKDPQTDDNIYCIEWKDNNSSYVIGLPLWGLHKDTNLIIPLKVVFSMPFNPVLPVIRKKIVSNGVHFQLCPNFAGISNKSEIYCGLLVIYGPNKKDFTYFIMSTGETLKKHVELQPGTEFDIRYQCFARSWMRTSTKIAMDRGTVFSMEKTQPLQPFLRFPFRRFLVGQWRNPSYVPEVYQIEIYEMSASNSVNCLKVFRLYSVRFFVEAPKSVYRSNIRPINCDKEVNTEDLGAVDLVAGTNVHAVLDMGVPLKKDGRYKMSIWWQNTSNQWEDNFIYFEPLPNENSGNIHSDIYNFLPSKYENIRNSISDMRQNVITQYSMSISSARFLSLSKFDEMIILPSVSTSPFYKVQSPKTISYDELNKKCKDIPSCSNGFHPLFYVMLTNKSQTDNFVELLPIPLKESFYVNNLKLMANPQDSTFTISWEIPQQKTNIPSLFAILMKSNENKCFASYILTCRTCNKEHQKIAESNFKESWKNDCQTHERLDNYYGAMDSSITFKTKEMVANQIFEAYVSSINLYNTEIFPKSNSHIITESFWRKYGTAVISVISTIIGLGLIICISIWLKTLLKEVNKESDVDDSNKYYNEDEL